MAKAEMHYHACTHCRRRYPDACTKTKANDVCNTCVTGRLSIYAYGIEPRPCCYENLRVARKDELKTYKLAGTGPWWICTVCCRQFGYDVRLANV